MTRVTKINRMEIRGFKSFNKKTVIDFGDAFNCVLGPNGAGKSNVFDALIFVLGKSGSKGMRAEKSANLIYNGGKTKEPAKEGSVAIYFDNKNNIFATGNPEVELKRVIRKTGSSKYVIDGKTRTRAQVVEILSRAKIDPDSHNIILQGDIVRLVEMSPLERRGMIEEIAGITIYEDKKEKALRELNRVEEKLNEADIILTERKSYLRELKKERDQALKFKDLDEKIKRNKATLIHLRKKEKKVEIDKYDKQANETKAKLDKLEKEIKQFQDKISVKKNESEDINKEIEKKGEKEQVALHKEVEQLRVDLALKEQRQQQVKQELQKIEDRKSELEKDLKDLEAKLKDAEEKKGGISDRIKRQESQVAELESKIEVYRSKNNLEDAQEVDKRVEEIDKEADKAQEIIQSLREEQQKLLREKDSLEIQLQSIDEKITKVLSVEKENKQQLDQLKKDKDLLKSASHELNSSLSRDSELASELSTVRGKLDSKRESLSKLQAQSASIREGIAGSNAITEILKLGWPGIHGTISDLGQVNSEFSLALEIAAGGRLKSIVVENDEVASKCIKHLKQNKLGVATFLPLNKLKPQIIPTDVRNIKGEGVHGLAINLVEYDKKFEKAFQYVFGSTLVVKNIETSRKIGIGKTRMITLEGDLVETSGAMQGGFRSRKRHGLGFQDKEVKADLDKLQIEVSDLESVASKLEKERKQLESKIEKLREEKAILEGSIIKIEKSLHIDSADLDASKDKKSKLQSELKEIESRLSSAESDIATNTQQLTKLKVERQQLREQLTNLRNPAVLAELNTFEEKRNELKAEIAEIKGEARGLDSEVDNVFKSEQESIKNIIKQHDKEEKEFLAEEKLLKKELETRRKDLIEMEKKQAKFHSQFKGLFDTRQKLGEEISDMESKILVKNERIRESELKNNSVSLENARAKAELSALEVEGEQYQGVSVYKSKDEDEIKREVQEFENLASGIGAVNMKALEIYEQVEIEYNKLLEKKQKLTSEREDVLVMINKIDSRKKELFMKTYDVLNKNFRKIFDMLSRKGDASLELEDPKDPLSAGVTIKVRLVGKKFLDIRSLSGGEKTLTALAFIFSVQEYEPAPFYIMDEVDAALDKRNSEKLAKLLSSYSQRAQYIIISHNDSVITDADNLYGVSMNEHGESKITTLKI
ncbi:chromosome segregation protein SMC [Nanoarchaeota archaeon]